MASFQFLQGPSHQLYNPFQKFSVRVGSNHNAEDTSRLCPEHPISTPEAIDRFIAFGTDTLELAIPRTNHAVKVYLEEAIVDAHASPQPPVAIDISGCSSETDIVLVDDRYNHDRCAKLYEALCNLCRPNSRKITIPQLYEQLKQNRIPQKAEKRIIFIPNLTPAGALALVATVSRRTCIPLREFLQRYIRRQSRFAVQTSWGFFLEFHLPYFALRRSPKRTDRRGPRGTQLRLGEELPLRTWSKDQEYLFYYEAQISSLSLGPDEWFWTEYFLVETYFGSEGRISTYFEDCDPGDGFDPPLGGIGRMNIPRYDPREYWLMKVERRVLQVTKEYAALVDTFDARMENYEKNIANVFEDDPYITHTRVLANVISTIQLFSGYIYIASTLDAWKTFRSTQISYFTTFGKPEWQIRIDRIIQDMSELERLRNMLLNKQERFECKLRNLSTVSSLIEATQATRQTDTAIRQGDNINTLTQMTVYIAFPLLFTTALFSMQFMQPPLPWLVFFGVLTGTTISNYIVAPYINPLREWMDRQLQKAWTGWHGAN